jgi:hypothetical protein
MLLIIVLALADKAIHNISTLEELLALEPSHTGSIRTIPFQEDKWNEFILLSGQGRKAMSDGQFHKDYRDTCTRAGYKNINEIVLYDIHRGLQIESKVFTPYILNISTGTNTQEITFL